MKPFRARLPLAAALAATLALAGCSWRSAPAPALEPGAPLPLVSGPSLDGGADIDLARFAGAPVVLHVYASWSAPSRRVLPELLDVRRETGVAVVSLNLDIDDGQAKRDASFRGLDWPIIHTGKGWRDPSIRRLGVEAMPRLIVVGADGLVLDPDVAEGDLRRVVDEALAASAR